MQKVDFIARPGHFFKAYLFILRERERERKRAKRETESQAGSKPSAQSPTRGFNLQIVRS